MTLRLPHLFLVGLPVLIFQCSAPAMADGNFAGGNPHQGLLVGNPHEFNVDEGKSTTPSVSSVPPPDSTPSPSPSNPATDANSTKTSGENAQTGTAQRTLGGDLEEEQESARSAVASGKAAPLTALLKKLKADYPGEILGVALNQVQGQYVFDVKYLDRSGLIKIVSLNALTLESQ